MAGGRAGYPDAAGSPTEKAVSSYVDWAWRLLHDGAVVDQEVFLQECIDRIELDGELATIFYSFTPIGEEKQ